MAKLENLLSGGDLRSIGKNNSVISKIHNESDFEELFKLLYHTDRLIVMRSADIIEKITINNPQYLKKHTKEIIELSNIAKDKELKWHLALLFPRLNLKNNEFGKAWETLTNWAKDAKNSRIVRVNSIQGLFEMMKHKEKLMKDFSLTLFEIEKENIPSINARIRIIRKKLPFVTV